MKRESCYSIPGSKTGHPVSILSNLVKPLTIAVRNRYTGLDLTSMERKDAHRRTHTPGATHLNYPDAHTKSDHTRPSRGPHGQFERNMVTARYSVSDVDGRFEDGGKGHVTPGAISKTCEVLGEREATASRDLDNLGDMCVHVCMCVFYMYAYVVNERFGQPR